MLYPPSLCFPVIRCSPSSTLLCVTTAYEGVNHSLQAFQQRLNCAISTFAVVPIKSNVPEHRTVNVSRELGVQSVVDVGARNVRVKPHVPELQAVEGVAVYGRTTGRRNNETDNSAGRNRREVPLQ